MSGLLDRALDATIALSFDRTGYARHARGFDPRDDEVSLRGRTALVTGASSGIGRATALALLRRGAAVRLLCRDATRGREAEAALRAASGGGDARLELVDVSDLEQVRALAARLDAPRVDLLVHNAGVLPAARRLTPQGLEETFATHIAGPLLLTRLLEARLMASDDARVVLVSSGGMYAQRLSLDDLDWSRRPYDGVTAYAQTKRMQVVLAGLLQAEWAGSRASAHAMHPGWADTPAVRSSLPRFHRLTRRLLRTPEEGADTVVWLCAADRPRRDPGRFWFDRAPRALHLLPWTRETEAERRAFRDVAWRAAGLA